MLWFRASSTTAASLSTSDHKPSRSRTKWRPTVTRCCPQSQAEGATVLSSGIKRVSGCDAGRVHPSGAVRHMSRNQLGGSVSFPRRPGFLQSLLYSLEIPHSIHPREASLGPQHQTDEILRKFIVALSNKCPGCCKLIDDNQSASPGIESKRQRPTTMVGPLSLIGCGDGDPV